MKPSKLICIVVERSISERVGGVEIQTYLIGKYLKQKGWDIVFVCGTSDKSKIGSRIVFQGVDIILIKATWFFPFWCRSLLRTLKKIKPDIVYQRGRSYFTGSGFGIKYTKTYGKKFVYGCASDFDFYKFYLLKSIWNEPFAWYKKIVVVVNNLLQDFQYHKTLNLANLVIVQSKFQQKQFSDNYLKQSHIVKSGHEVPSLTLQKENPPIVFWIANAGLRKRLDIFVDLAKNIQKDNIKFIIAGTIPNDDFKKRIFSSMQGLRNIEYIGSLSWEESNAMFEKASIFVNTTSPEREGFPNTYIQAWMRETPVVTLHCDPDGVIEKHKLGFHSRSFDQMVKDVRFLIENDNIRKDIGACARRYAMENHSIEKSAETMNDLFLKLLGQGV
jgi:glycosyltransferase involved in cell wall biosynthesis